MHVAVSGAGAVHGDLSRFVKPAIRIVTDMTRVTLKPRTTASAAPAPPAPTKEPTHYATLGVAPGAALAAIHERYRALAFELHPDRGGNAEQFKRLALAWGVVKNEEARRRYDAQLRLERRACKECAGRGLLRKQASFTTVKEVSCKVCAGAGYF